MSGHIFTRSLESRGPILRARDGYLEWSAFPDSYPKMRESRAREDGRDQMGLPFEDPAGAFLVKQPGCGEGGALFQKNGWTKRRP